MVVPLNGGREAPINILIVDDEPKNLLVLESLLDTPGYRLVRAGSADEALLALMADDFALLILDVRMPGMTGFELAQTIKGRKKTAQIPIIFLTAYYNEDQHMLEGYGSGAVDYLHKPVNATVLRSKVAVFAELYRKGREVSIANRALLAEVAERRRAEAQLLALNAQLDRRVDERTHALSASDARLRLATGAVGLGIWTWQLPDAPWTWENEWPATILGLPHDAAPLTWQQLAQDFVYPEDRSEFEHAIAATVNHGAPLRFDGRVLRADGVLRTVEFIGNRVLDDDVTTPRVLGTLRDVTERAQAVASLRERERFLTTVTGAARIGLAVIDPNGRYRYANDAYKQMLHLGSGSLAGRPIGEVLGEEGWALARPHLQCALQGERASFEFSMAPTDAGAQTRHFGAFHEPHIDHEGLRTVAVVVVEITGLKQMEEELRSIDRRKDEFLATLAHELRNPLAPVGNAVRILNVKGRANPDLRWSLDVIERQVRVMARLIDDLMDVSRINQGRIELRREPVELAKVLDWAVEASRQKIEEFGHTLAVTLPELPVLLDADLTRLAQVFMNLLTNAAKYTDSGGRIDVSAALDDGDVVVTVRDNGIGIAEHQLSSVFVMFAQVESALSRSRGGLGIGLSLAQRLVELHGGRIEARSAGPGRGSEFAVRLPVRKPAAAAAVAAPATAVDAAAHGAAAAQGLRILVVDDNQDGADTLAILLSSIGHDVQTVYDGESGMAAAGEFRPEVVLLDIGLPKINGYEVCRRIRAQPWGSQVTLIAMTGWGDRDAQNEASRAGFDRHLVKPVDEPMLLSALAMHGAARAAPN